VRWLECLERAVGDLEAEPGSDGAGRSTTADGRDVRRGRGVAVMMKQTITPSRSEAAVALRADGVFEVRTSAVDMGQGVSTVLARIAGRRLGVGLDRIRPVLPDTAVTPFDVTSSASRLTASVGRAVELAADDLLDRLIEAASVALGVAPDRLTRRDGTITTDDGRALADAAVVAAAGGGDLVGRAVFVNAAPVDPETGIAATSSHWHQGAVAVEVAVDLGTGVVRVERAHGAAWAGEVLSLAGARLQNEGNIAWGIGVALTENLAFDADGAPRVRTFLDYRLPATTDLPARLTTAALEAETGATGHAAERHGLGESLVPAVAPAVGNAVAAATGGRVTELPIHPEGVLAALGRRPAR
jgi:CO/xanthine dehydrogenase Mo-binding subunit